MKARDITLGGLLISLQIIFILISNIFVGSELFLVIFLPLISTFFVLKSEKKSIITFMIISILISLLFNPIKTFIYIIPSLLVGIVYGLLRKKKVSELSLIYLTSIIHFISIIIIIFSFKMFYLNIDLINLIQNSFNLNTKSSLIILFLIFLFISFIQSFLIHLITNSELKKFGYDLKENTKTPRYFIIPCVLFLILTIIMIFFNQQIASFFSILYIIFIFPFFVEAFSNFNKKVLSLILEIPFFILSIFLLSKLNLVLLPFSISIFFIPFLINILKWPKKNI